MLKCEQCNDPMYEEDILFYGNHFCSEGKRIPPWKVWVKTLDRASDDAVDEVRRAKKKWPVFNSAHEGYAVLREEVDELWEEVKKRPDTRDLKKMREEAIQVAAMALRFATEVCDETIGRR